MKKLLLVLLTFSLVAILHAATATVNGIEWTYEVSNGEAQLFDRFSPVISTSTSGVITIPSTLGGLPVTSIGFHAFRNCSNLTSVRIPSSVRSIEEDAFYGCSGLTSVMIPQGVTFIGNEAFYNCSGLTAITIPSSVTSIGISAFSGCSGLTSVTIPSSVTLLGGSVFSGVSPTTLTAAWLPSGMSASK
ncbi:MAG: leucine-rich repeat domain-containing protein [Kiritimatiellae bacterium]|nr:leucine-rich repeat domain-containing protein [Kiritimatiellia bacterium]